MIALFLLMAAALLYLASLYQLEIVYIAISQHWPRFDMPFYIWSTENLSLARDIWYTVNAAAWILAGVGGYLYALGH